MDAKEQGPLQLRKLGLHYAGDGPPPAAAQTYQQQLSQAATLRDLAGEYHFYTLAIVLTRVRLMGRDPFADFLAEYNQEVIPWTLQFTRPIFKGMHVGADQTWNHVLFGLPKTHWSHFANWFGQVVYQDRDAQLVTRIRTQEIPIADPLYFERAVILPADCPTVSITAFVLDTNQGCHYFRVGEHPLLHVPELVYTPQRYQDTAVFGRALVTDDVADPYGRAAQALTPPGVSIEELELTERVRKAREDYHED